MKNFTKKIMRIIIKFIVVALLGTQATMFTPVVAQSPTQENSGSQPRIIQTLQGYSPKDYTLDEETYNKYILYTEVTKAHLSYADYKKLSKIAFCESGYRMYDENGSVLKNSKTKDGGLMQINPIHESTAEKLGLDLETLEGNIRYAIYLYKQNGARDWYSSYKCHKIK